MMFVLAPELGAVTHPPGGGGFGEPPQVSPQTCVGCPNKTPCEMMVLLPQLQS
jgi:hypothetical protein